MAQWDQWCLGSPEMQVRYPALHSGLKIWHCCSCSLGGDCGSDLIPGSGAPYATGWPEMGKKKKIPRREHNLQPIFPLRTLADQ